MPRIDDVASDRAFYRPGETARISVRVVNEAPTPVNGILTLSVMHLDRLVARQHQPVALGTGTTTAGFDLIPPAEAGHGYGLDATLTSDEGHVLGDGGGALDVLKRWSDAPRYGFLADFDPDLAQAAIAARAAALTRYHLNVVQFYDWMWRHYRLLPPAGDFTDALGRRLSLAAVRASIAAVHQRGAAAFAYGAVYGAEPEFADKHPELALFDADGGKSSLADLFYIMNIAPGSPWLPLIVAEFAAAVRALGFDGIHLDQYGFPKTATTAAGELVDLATHFPPLIEAARAAVTAVNPDAGVIFNAVGNWPIETVAPTSQDATYIEVWPPDETYNDLRRLIRDAKRLGGGKPVILAAYLAPFAGADAATLPRAEAAALLATATIAASGGSHLLLGERDGVLCDPYYPHYAPMRPAFAARMRASYDFLVRYEELLVASDVEDWEDAGAPRISLRGAPVSRDAAPGAVWMLARRKPGYRIIHLINLTDQADIAWNAPRTPPRPLGDIALTLDGLPQVERVWVATPDARHGRPQVVPPKAERGVIRLDLPRLEAWTMLVVPVHDEDGVNS